jgi:hypothetical protein
MHAILPRWFYNATYGGAGERSPWRMAEEPDLLPNNESHGGSFRVGVVDFNAPVFRET